MKSLVVSRGRVALLVAASIVAACAPLPTRDLRASRGEVADVVQHPSPSPSRADTVDRVWRTIADVYYDPTFNGIDAGTLKTKTLAESQGVTSDADFYRVLKRNVRALHDSHTLILTPREAEDSRVRRATQIGLVFAISEGRAVVASVVTDFPAERAGVLPGMIIEAVDGQPIDEAFFVRARTTPTDPSGSEPFGLDPADAERSLRLRAVRALLVSSDGSTPRHRMTLRRADDTLMDADVEAVAGDVPTRESLETRPSGINVLRLSRFDSAMRGQMAYDIERSRLDSKGLIIDLRANPGGEQRLFEWLVGRFMARRVPILDTITRAGSRRVVDTIESNPAPHPYLQPIAVLTDRGTASASELTAHTLVEERGAIAVGEATCGCVVAIRHDYVLPDGGALRVAQVGFRSAHGRRMEADPLLPAIAVVPTLAQRRARRDVVLEAAERALLAR